MLDRKVPEPGTDVGLRFGLTAATYERWWYGAVLPDDATEFVKVHGGNLDGARMVCAIDYLTNIDGRSLTPEVVVRAYCYATDQDDSMLGNASIRYEAQALYEHPAVQTLYAKLRSRTEAMGEDIIRRLLVGKVQALIMKLGDEPDPKMLSTLGSISTQLMSIRVRRDSMEQGRRDRKSYRAAMEAHDTKNLDLSKLPEPEETRAHLLMLRDAYGADIFDKLIDSVRTLELTD